MAKKGAKADIDFGDAFDATIRKGVAGSEALGLAHLRQLLIDRGADAPETKAAMKKYEKAFPALEQLAASIDFNVNGAVDKLFADGLGLPALESGHAPGRRPRAAIQAPKGNAGRGTKISPSKGGKPDDKYVRSGIILKEDLGFGHTASVDAIKVLTAAARAGDKRLGKYAKSTGPGFQYMRTPGALRAIKAVLRREGIKIPRRTTKDGAGTQRDHKKYGGVRKTISWYVRQIAGPGNYEASKYFMGIMEQGDEELSVYFTLQGKHYCLAEGADEDALRTLIIRRVLDQGLVGSRKRKQLLAEIGDYEPEPELPAPGMIAVDAYVSRGEYGMPEDPAAAEAVIGELVAAIRNSEYSGMFVSDGGQLTFRTENEKTIGKAIHAVMKQKGLGKYAAEGEPQPEQPAPEPPKFETGEHYSAIQIFEMGIPNEFILESEQQELLGPQHLYNDGMAYPAAKVDELKLAWRERGEAWKSHHRVTD